MMKGLLTLISVADAAVGWYEYSHDNIDGAIFYLMVAMWVQLTNIAINDRQ